MSEPTERDWQALARGLAGDLVRPGDDAYDQVRLPYNARYDTVRPRAVARCREVDDVREVVLFARRFGLPLAPRSGGHSYAGYSTSPGIVLDVSPLDTISVDGEVAHIGAGAQLVDVYDQLTARGLAIPGGSCPTVGIAGLTQGGGIGVVDRAYGLTSDRLVAAQVVTADGSVVDCDEHRRGDLFWALRGGGGGNFGVVTAFTFRTHRTRELTRFLLHWPWADAARAYAGWQSWGPAAPDEVWSALVLRTTGRAGESPRVLVSGVYLGGDSDLEPHLDRLVAAVGREPASVTRRTMPYRDLLMSMAGCRDLTVRQCHRKDQIPEGRLDRAVFVAASDVYTRLVPADGIQVMLREVAAWQTAGGAGTVLLDALGGAIARVPPDATAFVHRDGRYTAQYYAEYPVGTSRSVVAAADRWTQRMRAVMRPWTSGRAYQNYADPHLADWQTAYYGANYPRLVRVKAAYDPDWVFRFPQGIPPR